MKRPNCALVTGATGFIGRHLAKGLLAQGWQVHCLVRSGSDRSRLPEGAQAVGYDQQAGARGLVQTLESLRPDLVFHLASRFLAGHTPEDLAELIASNIQFGAELLEALSLSGGTRLVNAGTSWQHFENREYSPVNLYAATKQAFEALLQYYVEAAGLRCVTLKLFDTYGPGDPRPKLFQLLNRQANAAEALVMSPGEQLIDLVYIDDVVEAFLLAGQRLLAARVRGAESYGVSSGKPISLRQLVSVYARVSGCQLNIEWGGRPYRPREVMTPWSAGARLPGWQPRISLDEGIRRLMVAKD